MFSFCGGVGKLFPPNAFAFSSMLTTMTNQRSFIKFTLFCWVKLPSTNRVLQSSSGNRFFLNFYDDFVYNISIPRVKTKLSRRKMITLKRSNTEILFEKIYFIKNFPTKALFRSPKSCQVQNKPILYDCLPEDASPALCFIALSFANLS